MSYHCALQAHRGVASAVWDGFKNQGCKAKGIILRRLREVQSMGSHRQLPGGDFTS